jgi:hypothetical protein
MRTHKNPHNDNDEFRAYVGACTDALSTQTESGWPEMLLLPEPETDTERAAGPSRPMTQL